MERASRELSLLSENGDGVVRFRNPDFLQLRSKEKPSRRFTSAYRDGVLGGTNNTNVRDNRQMVGNVPRPGIGKGPNQRFSRTAIDPV